MEFGLDIYLADGAMSSPFMDVVGNVSGCGLVEPSEELQPSIMSH